MNVLRGSCKLEREYGRAGSTCVCQAAAGAVLLAWRGWCGFSKVPTSPTPPSTAGFHRKQQQSSSAALELGQYATDKWAFCSQLHRGQALPNLQGFCFPLLSFFFFSFLFFPFPSCKINLRTAHSFFPLANLLAIQPPRTLVSILCPREGWRPLH